MTVKFFNSYILPDKKSELRKTTAQGKFDKSAIQTRAVTPTFSLAPMEDVTDTVFRQIVADCGRPDYFFTEFVNVDGMYSHGREQVIRRLRFTPKEQPLIAQIWGLNPKKFLKAANELVAMGFAGVDINMGCPVRKVVARGACSGLIGNHALAREIIQATKEGVGGNLPVSVKTRIGLHKPVTAEWIGFLLEQGLHAITIHGRIQKQMSNGDADWGEIAKAVRIRDEYFTHTPHEADIPYTKIIGNGDVVSYADGLAKIERYGVDGVMVGRGIFRNPCLFDPDNDWDDWTPAQRLELMRKHVLLFIDTWKNDAVYGLRTDRSFLPYHKNFEALKKFFKIYINGFDGASQMRAEVMAMKKPEEVVAWLDGV